MNSFCNAVKRCEDLLNTPYFLFLFIHHLHLPLTKIKNTNSGCDEQDYSNACYAHSAGVSVAFEGKCSGEEEVDEDVPPTEEDTTEPIFIK